MPSNSNTSFSGTSVARHFSSESDELIARAKEYLKKSEFAKSDKDREVYARLASESMDRAEKMTKKAKGFL